MSLIKRRNIMKFAILTIAFAVGVVWLVNVGGQTITQEELHTIQFYTLKLVVKTAKDTTVNIWFYKDGVVDLQGQVKLEIPPTVTYHVNKADGDLKITWTKLVELTVHRSPGVRNEAHKYDLRWQALDSSVYHLENSFSMAGAHWYGAAEIQSQEWPIEKWSRQVKPFVTGDSFVDNYGGVQERYWLSSKGIALFVDKNVPLFVGMNSNGDGQLRFQAKFQSPYVNVNNEMVFLQYTVCQGSNVKSTHENVLGVLFKKPMGIPDERMFTHPIWSTWAVYKKNINEKSVLEFANQIVQHGFNNSQLEIDDDWTPSYGIWDFDRSKFPEPKQMITKLQNQGFRVTVWIHPFVTPFNRVYWSHAWAGRLIAVKGFPGIGYWWDGVASSLDLTNPSTRVWFLGALKNLQETYGVSSFKFDAGESNWLPLFGETLQPMANPNVYPEHYAELAYSADSTTRHQEVRVGTHTQHLPIFVRMMDKDSNWGYKNGLKTLIPHALTFGILGYPFVLPDMIGGNAYSGYITGTVYPGRELFIRWMQASVFLPALQFSIPPWIYDDEVVNITKQMTALHETFAPFIISLAKESTRSGSPIVRPLWWISPRDEVCLTIDSEFLVGDKILVAPVLDEGARSRGVYLPEGLWKDMLRGGILRGGKWYRDYRAELQELPYFLRQEI